MKNFPKSDLLFFRDQLIGQILVTLALFLPYVYKESEVHQGIDKVNGVWSSIYSTQSERLISFFTKLSASSNMNRLGSTTNQIEKLKNLKELLDEGILTQEEFEEKKKQILGL